MATACHVTEYKPLLAPSLPSAYPRVSAGGMSRRKMPVSEMAASFDDSLPTPPFGVYSRRRSKSHVRKVADHVRQSLLEVPASPDATAAPLFRLGQLLEHIVLMLDREDAMCFRATCRTVRAATLVAGFANMWQQAHPEEQKAKAAVAAMQRSFAALDEETLEVEVAQDEGIRWERVLPKRKATRTTSTGSSSSMASSSTSPAPSAKAPLPQQVPGTVGEASDMSAVKSYFDSLDTFELEVDSPVESVE